MGSIWFLGFCMLLAASSSSAEFQEEEHNGSSNSSIHLNLYHGCSLTPNSSSVSLYDILSDDEERVKSIANRLKLGKRRNISHSHTVLLAETYLGSNSIPLNPGLSIGSGNYYVKLGVGSPPKYYSMILDTGSSLSWLQCQPCIIYCHKQVEVVFEPRASRTYKTLSCTTPECSSLKAATLNDPACTASGKCVYTASYGDASYSMGYLSQDLLTLTPSQTLPRFTYGCGQDNEGLFGRAAGIVGLARNKLSMLAQLSTKNGYSAFSYCLPTATGGGGGFLSIGNIISPSSYKFTPMITNSKNPSLYFLRLAAITVGGRAAGGRAVGVGAAAAYQQVPTIIDSGTVITRLPMSMYAPLRDAFEKMMMSQRYAKAPGYSILDTCFKGTLKTLSRAPEIRMIFQGGASLSLGPSNALIEADNGVSCLAFAASNQIAIIGNHQQQTYSIAYDVSASRIGFAPSGCL